MRLPRFIHEFLKNKAESIMAKRRPDEVLGEQHSIYLERWYLIPHNRYFNVYLHAFHRSDEDRALHDHPWSNASILLWGAYKEHLPSGNVELRLPGFVYARRATAAHRIELERFFLDHYLPVVTLFITGRHVREWGFLCPQGWRHWRNFTKQISAGKSVGCGEYE